MIKKLKRLILFSLLMGLQSNAVIYTIGYGNDCDFDLNNGDTLQGAINASTSTELRLSKDVVVNVNGNSIVVDKPLVISGGYDNCTEAALGNLTQSSAPNTTLDGQALSRVMQINSNLTGEVVLRYLTIQNGSAGTTDPATQSGGGIYIPPTNQADITLENSEVTSNGAFGGGGIYFDGGSGGTLLTLKIKDTDIRNNTARNTATSGFNGGGGVFLTGGVRLVVSGESSFQGNTVDSTIGFAVGGGLFASAAEIYLFSAQDYQNKGFINNTSDYRGAGIYLGGDAILNVYGYPELFNGELLGNNSPYSFRNNYVNSGDTGGAIYSNNSDMYIEHARFYQNGATNGGGAIAMNRGQLFIDAKNPDYCWREQGCNLFQNNFSGSSAAMGGGAILADNNASVNIKHSLFHDNNATLGTSLAILNNSSATFESAIFYQEGKLFGVSYPNQNVIYSSFSQTILRYVNVIENETQTSILNAVGNTGENLVFNSIFYNPLVPDIGLENNNGTNSYDCLMADSNLAFVVLNAAAYATVFEDPTNLNFRLRPSSRAIDMCDGQALAQPTTNDLQGNYRGYDDASMNDLNGVFDAGAIEYNLDIIFRNGFE